MMAAFYLYDVVLYAKANFLIFQFQSVYMLTAFDF